MVNMMLNYAIKSLPVAGTPKGPGPIAMGKLQNGDIL